jgi:hypothetical protein
MTASRTIAPAAAMLVVTAIAGCGGGSGAPATPAAPKPAQARHALQPPPTPHTLVHWGYRADARDEGIRRGWAAGGFAARRVALPHVANGRVVTGAAGARAYAGSIGWYRRTIAVRGGRYSLRFASAHHRAVVWVDGRRRGAHTGAYEAFGVRARLRSGHHRVVVRVDWRSPARQRAEGWDRGWFNFGGLNRAVTITRLGASELGLLRLQTRLRPGGIARVGIAVRVRNDGPARTLRVRATLSRAGRMVPIPMKPAHLARGAAAALHTTIEIPRAALWSPGRPALWDLDLSVPGESTLHRRVGLRQVRWDSGHLELNGRRLVLRGASVPPDARGHGDAFTPADLDRIVAELRAIGANATRAQQPLPPPLLDRFDAAGILVWQEIGPWDPAAAWSARTPALRARATQRVLRTLDAEQAHPSVVAWSLGNEVAGAGHAGGQAAWIDRTAGTLHRLDPGRPVAVDLWGRHLPRAPGLLTRRLDVIGLTDYTGWYERPGAPAAVQAAVVRERLARMRALYPGRPLVVTEFGAAANGRNPAGAPGGLRYQAQLVRRRIGELRQARVDGMLVWTLRDAALRPDFSGGSIAAIAPGVRLASGINEKGLFTYGGRAKPAAAAVRHAFTRR